ncbi:hypothetical protein [Mycolicibacterium fortuitum]|uniref:hypothetical protein n=1 Tax=Mycolicibacterium fortuitum TaxID=1766 RepID=UPI00261EC6C4|nr:hypothetical protein [Mycolicibacterium fortuitum]
MAAVAISVTEIQEEVPGVSNGKAQRIINGTLKRAALFAPCILSDDFDADKAAAAKDILIEIIVRAIESGSGAVQSQSVQAGSYQGTTTLDTSKPRRRRFTRDEVRELRQLCGLRGGGAFSIVLTNDDADLGVENTTVVDA